MPSSSGKPRVVVLGGGIASLATAFELTDRPDWRESFASITVYQMGWRLGGKGASGRNANLGQRIEEHGLHVWPGFYENAFDLMRRCYDELNRPPAAPLAGWEDAFKRQHFIVVEEQVGGQWKHWGFTAPPNAALPGDAISLPTLWDEIVEALGMMLGWYRELIGVTAESDVVPVASPKSGPFDWGFDLLERGLACLGLTRCAEDLRERRVLRLLRSAIGNVSIVSDTDLFGVALQIARELRDRIADHSARDLDLVAWLVDRALKRLDAQLGSILSLSDTFRRLRIQLDFAHAVLRGVIRDRLLERGIDSIDGEVFAAWLRRHGASALTLDSALVRGFHDFVFAHENADPARPNLAAGVALRLILRLTFTYKGALMWKMQAGMGDVVFAPLYEVLKKRGVEFRFFHRVTQLKLSGDGRSVAEIHLRRQATLKSGAYVPLVDVEGLLCWPNQPRFEQLTEGPQLEAQNVNLESIWADWTDVDDVTLKAGDDFEIVVLGMSLAALPGTCAPLIQASAAWKNMVERIRTVQTQAVQLWFTPALDQLGWSLDSPILTAFVEPLETWADMSQTLPREAWPAHARPGSVAYFCSTFPDNGPLPPPGPHPFPEQQTQAVHDATALALHSQLKPLFPDACLPGSDELNWGLLHDPAGGSGVKRFDAQFWRANVEPTERYVQSTAGTTRYRLRPDSSGFKNLYLAGDWTRNGLNVGCIEAAVISGRRAARALLHDDRPIVGELDN